MSGQQSKASGGTDMRTDFWQTLYNHLAHPPCDVEVYPMNAQPRVTPFRVVFAGNIQRVLNAGQIQHVFK